MMKRTLGWSGTLGLLLAGAALSAVGAPFAYIANYGSNTVSVLDTATNKGVATIPVQSNPFGATVKPDGSRVYVTNFTSNTVTVIDAQANTVVTHIPVGAGPAGLAVKPDGTRVYVANYTGGTVSVIDANANRVAATIVLGGSIHDVAVNPSGTRVYVSRYSSNQVYAIDTATNAVLGSPITVGSNPTMMRVNPAGTRLYVVNYASNTLSVISLETDPPAVVVTIPVGATPWGVAVKPDGSRVYVSNRNDATVSVIDAGTNLVIGTIATSGMPHGLDVSPSGARLYVANYGANLVSVINTANNAQIATIPVGVTPISGGHFIGPAPTPATTARVSKTSAGAQGQGDSTQAAVSADGRYVAYASNASNLVGDDRNGQSDVFLYDRVAKQTRRISVGVGGVQPDGASYAPVISADGRSVAFASDAANLVAADTNCVTDVFVRQWAAGITTRVSTTTASQEANGPSYSPAINADGTRVAFTSEATNLVAGDTNGLADIFLRNRTAATTVRVSVATAGTQALGTSDQAAVSGSGQVVAFISDAPNLVTGDTNAAFDVFLRDVTAGTSTRVSVAGAAAQANRDSWQPALSSDGRYVAFASDATNLVPGDSNDVTDIFVRDRTLATTSLASWDTGGATADGPSYAPTISNGGRYVAFASLATLDPLDGNGAWDVYLTDRTLNAVSRLSVSTARLEANGDSLAPVMSADGRHVLFESFANNLLNGDTNNAWDIFARDRGVGTTPAYPMAMPAAVEAQ